MSQLLMVRPDLSEVPSEASLPPGYELRLYRDPDDLVSLAETLASAFDPSWTVERTRRDLIDAPDVLATYVVCCLDRVVATASSRYLPEKFPGLGYVHWIGTHRDHLRRGLGNALLVRLLHDFIARGYRGAVLETDDFRLPAIASYLKVGFVPEYRPGEEHDQKLRWSRVFQALARRGG